MQSSKEKILHNITQALSKSLPQPFPEVNHIRREKVMQSATEELTIMFAQNFSAVQGQFVYCIDEADLADKLTELQQKREWKKIFCRERAIINTLQQRNFRGLEFGNFAESPVAITGCENLIARTGSILMSTAQSNGRTTSIYTPLHICVAYTSQIVYDIYEGLNQIQKTKEKLPSLITLATGPSCTSNIENTLVMGMHGPQEVFCFVVEDLIK